VHIGDAAANVYFIEPDHLGTPRLIADENQKTVWRWDNQEPFGNDSPNEDPDGDGVAFDFPLRFPGQYFDRETNLAYNYFRDYAPDIGRYFESDPIGLRRNSLNTFAYVNGSPLRYVDTQGLEAEVCVRPFYPALLVPYARHCFVRFNQDDQDTSSYDPEGTHKDPAPSWWPKSCKATEGTQNDDCVKREMATCRAEDYDVTGNNCCHCVERALRACGLRLPARDWPNWPVNPGPQPGEQGATR
jgi:RHS repeat-associated protein